MFRFSEPILNVKKYFWWYMVVHEGIKKIDKWWTSRAFVMTAMTENDELWYNNIYVSKVRSMVYFSHFGIRKIEKTFVVLGLGYIST